jgi:putative transposase
MSIDWSIAHVTARGNARQAIFLDDIDYALFLTMAGKLVSTRLWLCHAFCLMPNHYHFVIETPEGDLGRGMHLLNGRYARRFNQRHERTDHVFGGRYHAEPVRRDSHLVAACRYVVLNPVRAGLCADPAAWAWSSYATTAGIGDGHSWVHVETVHAMVGGAAGFRRFVAGGIDTPQPA